MQLRLHMYTLMALYTDALAIAAVLSTDLEFFLLSLVELLNILVDLLVVVVNIATYKLLGNHIQWVVILHELLFDENEEFEHVVVHRVDSLHVFYLFVYKLNLVLRNIIELLLQVNHRGVDGSVLFLMSDVCHFSLSFERHELLFHCCVELPI